MNKTKIEIPENMYQDFVALAMEMETDPDELIIAALQTYEVMRKRRRRPTHSLWNHTPVSLGRPLKPCKSRSDLLSDFLDR